MSKISNKNRAAQIKKKQKRHRSLKQLKELYHAARTASDKKAIVEKLIKLAPYLKAEEFLGAKK